VQNGIVENYQELRGELKAKGHQFNTETDTEVLANLIEHIYLKGEISAEQAVRLALRKVVSNIQEVKARGGIVIAVVNKEDKIISKIADHVFEAPSTVLALAPLLTVIPLQLLSYHIAVKRNCNVDQPRNLAKSVTVE